MSTASRPVAVVSAADRERFCAAPGFSRLSRAALDRQRPDALWLLAGNDSAVRARCALWWKRAPIHEGNRVGLIGDYAARDAQTAAEMLNLASSQLSEHGCALAVGPMDGSTWQNYRLVVERGSEVPFFMEPDNPDDWPGHFLENGFTVLAHYYSALNADLSQQDPDLPELVRHIDSLGIRVRPLCFENLSDELGGIHNLSIECFAGAFLFTPISRDDFLAQYLELRDRVRPELVLLAEQCGRLIGYIFALPDLLQARRGVAVDTMIIKTLAVHPDFQGAGVGRLLAAQCHEAARRLGFRRAIHALMLDTSAARKISDRMAQPMRRYALFARPLERAQ